jgi:hypothetical protein
MEPVALDPGELALLLTLVSSHLDTLTGELKLADPQRRAGDERLFQELTHDYEYTTRLYQKLNVAYAQRGRA